MAHFSKCGILFQLKRIIGNVHSCGREVTSLSAFQTTRQISTTSTRLLYDPTFRLSIEKPEDFWSVAADRLVWDKMYDKVLDDSRSPFTQWFPGGEMNVCNNAVDRHVQCGRGEQVAIIHDSAITESITRITYNELLVKVQKFAGVLRKHGVEKGDRVLIYMPMIPEAIIVMLACARIGAVHSLVFGGFASKELATRIRHAEPKVIVGANVGLEPGRTIPYKPLLDAALELVDFQPLKCIIFNRKGYSAASLKPGRDIDFEEEMVGARPVDYVPIGSMDPLYILYTSGTTGEPKAVLRPSAGYAVVLHWSMYFVYGLAPGEVWWAASDLGWVVGHSYINYAPLLHGNTTVLFEGKPVGTPNAGTIFRVLKEHNVAALFIAPTAVRAIRREDPSVDIGRKFMPLTNFRILYVAGEHCDRETMEWAQHIFKTPVLDNWWQTETGWPMTSTSVGMGMQLYPRPGVTGKPVPGWNVKVVRKDNTEAEPHELGQILVKLPLPPGAFSTLYNNDERFVKTYFTKYPGYYDTMDSGTRDENGYISVLSRTDDVINVAGHRLSTAALEEAILMVDEVAEAAVVGVKDSLKGEIPVGLIVLKTTVKVPHEVLTQQVVRAVRDNIGPVAAFKNAIVVPKVPKTRSGKIARNTIKAIAEGREYKIPVTIEDASIYPILESELKKHGFPSEEIGQESAFKR